MRAQNVPQFSIQWMHCSQGLPEGATPGYKQRLQVMSRTVPPCHSERKVVWTKSLCTPCQPLIIDQFWFITLPQSVMGRSDCSIIKNPYFGSPLPHFSKYFFLDLVPPSKKLQMQTQIQTKTEKMTCIFFIERWLQILHLADSLLTPCWQFVDTLLTIVQV